MTDAGSELTLTAGSEEETLDLGRRLGQAVRGGDLLGLIGPLGAGKTCLVRGLAEGLRIAADRVRSPSFTLVNTYNGGRLPLHHIDLYRIEPTDHDRMALREYLYGDGVCAVEWFERLGEMPDHLAVEIEYDRGHERRIHLRACGDRYRRLVEALR